MASSIGLGLALARPDRRVIVCDGDGSLLMNLGALATIGVMRPANLTMIVWDNALYGTIRLHQERTFPGRVAGTELWSPDLVRYAEAFGGLGLRVERNEDITDALRVALAHPGIAVVSVAVARETIAVGTRLSEVGRVVA